MEPAPRRLRRALERRKPISPRSYRLLRTRHRPAAENGAAAHPASKIRCSAS